MNQGLTQQKSAPPRWLFWLTLILTLCVIVWGAYVRISGSGAGCGRDWPLCKKLFAESSAQTLVEFVHRATSGLTLILIFVQGVWVLRTHSKRHPARGAAIASMILIITESLIGAALVLKELVALNTSVARGIWIALHLTNTFLLLAALLLTLQWSTRDHFHVEWRKARLWLGALALILTTGIAGAISALSDTLFPAASLAHGLAQDFSPASHAFLRFRLLHPLLAFLSAGLILYLARRELRRSGSAWRTCLVMLVTVVFIQLITGIVDWLLLTPAWMQLLHLLLADLLWLSLVSVTARLATTSESSGFRCAA